ncbi:Nickel-binding periplasmic protein [Escherichia coli]|nr:Nickel-binding periplasmic protein [Escherichia coli]
MLSTLRRTLFALLACASFIVHAAAPDEITTAWPVNVGPLNPHLYTPNQMFAQSMVYEPLVKYQADGSVIPWLAKSWTHSEDGKTWTFTLRDDVKFSNGEPFDAEAAAENFRAVLDNRQRHAWLELANQIVDVKALSKTELQITLKSAYYPFLQELALPRPFRFIAPSQFKNHETMNGIKAPIGTGPWVLQESKLNKYDVFVRNENYWGEKPAIKKITFNVIPDPTTRAVAFETSDIDLLYGNEGLLPLDTFARFSQNPAYHTQLSQPIETVMLALNTAKAPTNELAVREALNYAVNKKSLIDNALYGTQQVSRHLCCSFCALCQPRPETAPVRSAESESVAGKSRLDVAPCGQRHPREKWSAAAQLNCRFHRHRCVKQIDGGNHFRLICARWRR